MLKGISKRFLSLVLAAVMVFSLLPGMSFTAYAATTLGGLTVNGLSATYDGGTWTAGGTTINGSATGTKGSCNDSAGSGSLTLISTRTDEATLSFDYSLTLNDGTVQIDGTSVTVNGHFEKKVTSDDTIKINLMTKEGAYTTSVVISNLSLVVEKEVTTTFVPAENGSFTVDGEAVTEETVKTQLSTVAYSLVAKPASGYKFLAWYSETTQNYLGFSSTAPMYYEDDQRVMALFVPQTSPIFEAGGRYFTELNEAVTYAQSNSASKITLMSDGILPAGDYTIPNGITLLIPFDDAGTMYTTTPANTSNSYSTPSAFRTLTMEDGAHIIVNGAISVSAKHAAAPGGGNYGGSPTGKVGFINMNGDSAITINSGGALYAWGFITGTGRVSANSGAKVYENFQIADFRGGSATSNLASGPIFPFSQYYVQNIEVPLTIHSGAVETVYSSLYAMGGAYSTSIEFIGNNGMFKLADGSSLTKTYDGTKDRLIFDLNGDAELKNLTVKVAVATVNSSNFNLPINSNITLNLNAGATTINQTVDLLPGVEANIADGATLKVAAGKKIHIYDGDQWGNYTMSAKLISVPYAPGKTHNRSSNDLKDVLLDINGTIEVDGAIYTTESGADITSTAGNGKAVFNSAAGTDTTTQQYQNNNTKVDIPITSAKLHNEDDSYTETADAVANDYYTYANGKWTKNGASESENVTITFDANDGSGKTETQEVTSGEDVSLNANTFVREGYEFTGWNTEDNGSGVTYADNTTVNLSEDLALYAQWEAKKYTVTWVDEDGTVLETDTDVTYGSTPEYNGTTPAKESTEQYSYEFAGWTPAVTPVTADVTYKATYSEYVNKYTVTWKNEDGTVLDTKSVDYGETPVYSGEIPTKEATAENTYAFSGWTPEITVVTTDVEYTAVFTSVINSYTVIWKNWDGSVLETDENVEYGSTPEYNGATPVHEGTDQYSYEFIGWTPELNTVTGDIIYTATFSETVNNYTVTWKNGDEVIKTESVAYGETPVYAGEVPTKESTAQYSYSFAGWTPEISTVTGNATYSATFDETLRSYTIRWVDADGVELEVDHVEYGTVPQYDGSEPTREEDAQYTYVFKGWTPEIALVDGDAIYTAEYETTVKTYTVIWVDADGTELEKDTDVAYGTTPTYNGEIPSKSSDSANRYEFAGWTPDISAVEKDITYTATYTAYPLRKCTVTFDANGGEGVMNPQIFVQGNDTSLEENGFIRKDHTFAGWNTQADGSGDAYADQGAIIDLEEDMTLYAQWKHNDGFYESDQDFLLYYKDGKIQKTGWTEINGNLYYMSEESGYIPRGGLEAVPYPEDYGPDEWDVENDLEKYRESNPYYETISIFLFDEDGVFQKDYTGMYNPNIEGIENLWIVNGELKLHAGLVEDKGKYYYFNWVPSTPDEDTVYGNVKNCDYTITRTNNLSWPAEWGEGTFTAGKYTFTADGSMLLYDGFTDIADDTYYYVKGIKTYAGLIKIEEDYYYVNSACKVVKNRKYSVSRTNGLLPAGTYEFDADGKMIRENTKLNGIVKESDSKWYYYVDGSKVYAGLILIDGDYYYVNSKFEVIHGRDYFISKRNGLLENKTYTFDENGKLIVPDAQLNGIVKETADTWYYYVDGIKSYAGLIKIDDAYYYVTSSKQVVHGRSYFVSKTNGLMASGTYEFDADGKMVTKDTSLNGIVKETDDVWYYYVNGVKTYAGLVKLDGSYYYVNTQCQVIHGKKYFITKTNGLMEAKSYVFGDDGKMVE